MTRQSPDEFDDTLDGMLVRPVSAHWRWWRKNRPKHPRHDEKQIGISRLASLSGIRSDFLLPVRLGYDYVGGEVAAMMVTVVGGALLLLFVLRH